MSEPSEAPSRARSATLAAAALVLLALPFFVFGVATLDMKSRVDFQCAPGGPCTLTRSSWLSRQEVGRFTLEELRGTRVARDRKSSIGGEAFVWRPMLETARGDFPLSYAWMKDEALAESAAGAVRRYLAQPSEALSITHDDRKGAGRLGTAFVLVGVAALGLSGWLWRKARHLRRAERDAVKPGTVTHL